MTIQPYVTEPTFPFTCEVCGRSGLSWSPRAKACGPRCKKMRNQLYVGRYQRTSEYRQAERKRAAEKAGRRYRTAAQRSDKTREPRQLQLLRLKKPKALAPTDCIYCLKAFTPANVRQTCCSVTCRQRYESKRRKARLRGLSPVVITVAHLVRRGDRYCGLCRQLVDQRNVYPHPMSPTVDHIVPLTKGGAHQIDNTQLAHARCNTSKGNRYVA